MRNNQKRLRRAPRAEAVTSAQATPSLGFVSPTEFVELPSRGEFYPEDHPLHKQETVEIKFMTAKDEDILSSQALLKKGLAIDRLLESLMVLDVDARTLLLGDRNAMLIAARISGYGSEYNFLSSSVSLSYQVLSLESTALIIDLMSKKLPGIFYYNFCLTVESSILSLVISFLN